MFGWAGIRGDIDYNKSTSQLLCLAFPQPTSDIHGAPFASPARWGEGSVSSSRISPSQDFDIAADVQLHNRADLLGALGSHNLAQSDDSELLLAAYEKWGEKCVDFLLGEFAFAIWDHRRRRLFCCRDHVGSRPFHYFWRDSRFIFATNPLDILKTPDFVAKLNRRKLAAMSVLSGGSSYPEETLYDGILALPAATTLIVAQSGVEQQTYWEPRISPDLVPACPRDAFEALRELLIESVDCRIRGAGRVASLLSGGLDSSAVTGIASRCLAKRNLSLLALAGVLPPDHSPDLSDEREYIDEFSSWPSINIEYITAAGRGPFDGIEDPVGFYLMPFRTSRLYMYEAFEDAAVAHGSEIIVEGDGGEFGLTARGDGYPLELAATLRWSALARQLRELQSVSGESPPRVLARDMRHLLPTPSGRPFAMLARDFRAEQHTASRREFRSINHQKNQIALLSAWLTRRPDRRATTVGGRLRTGYPWRDKRVLEFCISAPGAMKIRDGYRRYLVRGALQGILPPKICWRTTKGPFSPDYYLRYNTQLGKAKDFVAAIGPHDPVRSIVDVAELEKLLYPVDVQKGSMAALAVVPCSIYLINFLRQFAEFRP